MVITERALVEEEVIKNSLNFTLHKDFYCYRSHKLKQVHFFLSHKWK